MPGPLERVRVLEFSQMIAAPHCGMLLADMGADVIKVEPPGGEPWRLASQFIPLESKTYISLNRGKQSLPLDIMASEARPIIHDLVKEVDVVIVNYRPDVPARAGIDYETLSAINPRLIYCENTAFGRQGADSYRPGYDIIIQSMSGLVAADNKVADGVPQPITGAAVADTATGIIMAYGIVTALLAREWTGRGRKVEASLLATALAIQTNNFTYVDAIDGAWMPQFLADLRAARDRGADWEELEEIRRTASPVQRLGAIYYRIYKTKDSYLSVGCLSANLRKRLSGVLGLTDPRIENPAIDLTNPHVREILEQFTRDAERIFGTKSTTEWLQILDAAGVPSGPVRFVQELFDDPQALAKGLVADLEHPLVGSVRMVGPTLKLSETPAHLRGSSPPLGQDTDAILTRLGYTAEQIDALRAKGVTR
jgi:crotonobetainyl-CoA:carnitine CoA-transferase CaiB-like acyl-CoA transferase